jgi:hypothetical protein
VKAEHDRQHVLLISSMNVRNGNSAWDLRDLNRKLVRFMAGHRTSCNDSDRRPEHRIAEPVTIRGQPRDRNVRRNRVRGNRVTPSEMALECRGESKRVRGVA